MYKSLYHLIVLILIIHVLWYDTKQENYYLIRKVIDKIGFASGRRFFIITFKKCPLRIKKNLKLPIFNVKKPHKNDIN